MAEVQDMPQMDPKKLSFSMRFMGTVVRLFQQSGEEPETMRLISIAISHYVEKVRWALELGSRRWTEDGHLPGLHSFFTIPVTGGKSMTPCLVTRDATAPVLCDSTIILQYLCNSDPSLSFLYPKDIAKEVEEWEEYVDQHLGVPMRRFAYSIILRHKKLACKIIGAELPWIERRMLPIMYGMLIQKLKKLIAVDLHGNEVIEETAAEIDTVFELIAERLQGRRYLCGDQLTAADIALASLCYPVSAAALPEMWNVRMPPLEEFPLNYQEQIKKWINHPTGQYVIRIYSEHRFLSNSQTKTVQITNPNPRNNFIPVTLLLAACLVGAFAFGTSRA